MIFSEDKFLIGPWVCEKTEGTWSPESMVAMGNVKDGEVQGGVLYDHYNGKSICMHVAGNGNWMTKTLLKRAFDYPFNKLKVIKVLGMVDSTNLQAIRFDEKLGFKLETIIEDAGRYGHLRIYSMTKDQCRWI